MMKQSGSDNDSVGCCGAILGFFGAIKICEREGLDWRKVAELVELETRDQRNLEHGS